MQNNQDRGSERPRSDYKGRARGGRSGHGRIGDRSNRQISHYQDVVNQDTSTFGDGYWPNQHENSFTEKDVLQERTPIIKDIENQPQYFKKATDTLSSPQENVKSSKTSHGGTNQSYQGPRQRESAVGPIRCNIYQTQKQVGPEIISIRSIPHAPLVIEKKLLEREKMETFVPTGDVKAAGFRDSLKNLETWIEDRRAMDQKIVDEIKGLIADADNYAELNATVFTLKAELETTKRDLATSRANASASASEVAALKAQIAAEAVTTSKDAEIHRKEILDLKSHEESLQAKAEEWWNASSEAEERAKRAEAQVEALTSEKEDREKEFAEKEASTAEELAQLCTQVDILKIQIDAKNKEIADLDANNVTLQSQLQKTSEAAAAAAAAVAAATAAQQNQQIIRSMVESMGASFKGYPPGIPPPPGILAHGLPYPGMIPGFGLQPYHMHPMPMEGATGMGLPPLSHHPFQHLGMSGMLPSSVMSLDPRQGMSHPGANPNAPTLNQATPNAPSIPNVFTGGSGPASSAASPPTLGSTQPPSPSIMGNSGHNSLSNSAPSFPPYTPPPPPPPPSSQSPRNIPY
uniref:Uncharacterized protein n=1 Tax=Polytomella parva TaxID=51329 RepID=A0A7S0YN40_9CHLO|mmetsp:Transcript_34091/g.61451  ORF Transcript_34091/g.61451 Transcript_34091/m.61451 type:complete len:577 (+) Transcript_34091:209-1939(+)